MVKNFLNTSIVHCPLLNPIQNQLLLVISKWCRRRFGHLQTSDQNHQVGSGGICHVNFVLVDQIGIGRYSSQIKRSGRGDCRMAANRIAICVENRLDVIAE